ncbi:MAG: RNA polymerase sigma factor [Mycobacteriales bacterium]
MDSNQASDADLWARVRAGDGDAIAGLYDRYADRIHAYCFRRTGSLALAQDLTSTVWLEAWRNRGKAQVHQNGSLAPWLFGITHNVLRNSERAQRRYRTVLDKLPQPVDEPDQAELVSGRLPAPPLVACVLHSGQAAVYPGTQAVCEQLGLPLLAED